MRICPTCELETEELYCPQHKCPTMAKDGYGSRSEDLVGKQFADKYQILKLLGRGTYGSVYQARHESMDRMVAVKVMNLEMSSDMEAVKRFFREVRAASKLEHPNTIRIYDFGTTKDSRVYYTMELLTGCPLSQIISEGPLAEVRVRHLTIQIVKALAEAHAKGIVHRDLKPDNIFVSQVLGEGEFVKVLDFGLVKFIHGDRYRSRLTADGETVGTPAYMSPELASGSDTDHRSDLYSLGVITYEMLCRRPPFIEESAVKLMVAQLKKRPPELPSSLSISAEMRELVRQLLEKDPAKRPSSAQQVAARLQRIGRESFPQQLPYAETIIMDGLCPDEEAPVATAPTLPRMRTVTPDPSPTSPQSPENLGTEPRSVPEDRAPGRPEAKVQQRPPLPGTTTQPSVEDRLPTHPSLPPVPASMLATQRPGRKTRWPVVAFAAIVILAALTAMVLWALRADDSNGTKVGTPSLSNATADGYKAPQLNDGADVTAGPLDVTLTPLLVTIIHCNEPGATVYVDGTPVGKTPHPVVWPAGTVSLDIKIVKNGYQAAETTIKRVEHGGRTVPMKLIKRKQ